MPVRARYPPESSMLKSSSSLWTDFGSHRGWNDRLTSQPHNSILSATGSMWDESRRPTGLTPALKCLLPSTASRAMMRDSRELEQEVKSTFTSAKTSGMLLSLSSIHNLLRGRSSLEKITANTLCGNILSCLWFVQHTLCGTPVSQSGNICMYTVFVFEYMYMCIYGKRSYLTLKK